LALVHHSADTVVIFPHYRDCWMLRLILIISEFLKSLFQNVFHLFSFKHPSIFDKSICTYMNYEELFNNIPTIDCKMSKTFKNTKNRRKLIYKWKHDIKIIFFLSFFTTRSSDQKRIISARNTWEHQPPIHNKNNNFFGLFLKWQIVRHSRETMYSW